MKRQFLAALLCVVFVAASSLPSGAAADSWFEIKSAHFTVWANANDRATRTLVWQLEQIRNVARTLWPWFKVELPKPLVIIAARDEQTMKTLAPQYWEVKGGVRPVSVWVSGADQHYIAIRSDVRAEDNVSVNPHTSAYFSYANLALGNSFEPSLPLWLSRGLAGVLSNTLVRQNDVLIGAAIPWHLEQLRARRIPLAQMMAVSPNSPELKRSENAQYFDAQCWGFVHYLMFGQEGRHAENLNSFVGLLGKGQPPEAAFAAAFGSVPEFDAAFSSYVNRSVFPAVRVKGDAGVDRERFPTRQMSPAEGALARASFHATMGRATDARALLADVVKAEPDLPGPSVVEAMLLERAGNIEGARTAYAKAVELGTANYYALYRSAALSIRDADRAGLEAIETNLTKCVDVNPSFARAHAMLAEVKADLKRPQLTIVPHMQKGVTLDPTDPWNRISAARVLARFSAFDEARKAAESARRLAADDPSAMNEADRILAMLKGR